MRRPIARDQNQRKRAVGSQVARWAREYYSFTPMLLPNLALWLDAADTATITQSGGAVSQWNDKSGNGRHFSQATVANRPTTGVATQMGLNVITFDGTTDRLTLGSNSLLRNVVGATYYVVYKHSANPTVPRTLFYVSVSNPGRTMTAFGDGSTSQRSFTAGRTVTGNNSIGVTGSAVIESSYLCRTVVFDYANTDLFNYLNGVLDGSTTSFQTETVTDNVDSSASYVGAASGEIDLFSGEIAEILLYRDAHTAEQRLNIETYLKAKWWL